MKKRSKHSFNVLFSPGWYDYRIHQGVAEFARDNGWHLNADMAFDKDFPKGWSGDGILSLMTYDEELRCSLEQLQLPWVDMSLSFEDAPATRVVTDNGAIGRLGAEHFIGKGFRHFVFYGGGDYWIQKERRESFFTILDTYGKVEFTCLDRNENFAALSWGERMNVLANKLSAFSQPLAVFAAHDRMALEILEACLHVGMEVPYDVAVLGVNNLSLICESLSVPLSSIDSNHRLLGYRAAEKLHERMMGGAFDSSLFRVTPAGVVRRRSTDAFGCEHPGVRKALQLMDKETEISVEEIAKRTAMSRRGLENAFRKELGSTPGAELRKLNPSFP